MHELPKDLSNSLRSWRGSICGNSVRNKASDLEKGEEDYGDKDFERALSPSHDSSIILHPSKSQQALDQARKPQQNGTHTLHHQSSQTDLSRLNTQNRGAQPSTNNASAKQQKEQDPQTALTTKKSIFDAPKVDDPDNAADRLDDDMTPLTAANFYELIGMRPPISKEQNPKELAMRHGLFGRINERYRYINSKYRAFDVLTYVLLVMQLILSAVFIVLGSLSHVDAHVAIAVLGAVSTVIAGSLALMKGQGLPNRLRQYRDGLRKVIFEAEELYWDVGAGKPVLYKDVQKVRTDFLRVEEEERRNHPDTWNTIDAGIAKGITTEKGKSPTVAAGATPRV